ncbi:peptidyl-prolyl cis-trans isomerase [Paenibacillus sp. FSL H8-0537]|uniref:peptidylprolyl isomerase n=1 Tax=Paenibacillus sp. FSL H8-0537 TaxID=2921399 RepID=UPI0031018E70
MNKIGVVRTIVVIQALCMIVLSVVVVVRLSPFSEGMPDHEPDSGTRTETGNEVVPGSLDNDKIVAIIGDYSIRESELMNALSEQYGQATLKLMMIHSAIDQEAASQQLEVTAEEQQRAVEEQAEGYDSEEDFYRIMDQQLGMSKEEVLKDTKYRLLTEKIAIQKVDVPDAEVERYIADHEEQYGDKLQYRLSWIVTANMEEANRVLDKLSEGADFAQAAAKYSIDAFTADAGGDLGLIDANDPFHERAILSAASKLDTGEIAGPISIAEGYAIIRLMERHTTDKPQGQQLYELVRKELALSQAPSLSQIEQQLLEKYDAVTFP